MLEKEQEEKKLEREATLKETLPSLQMSGLSMQDLQVCSGDCMNLLSHYNKTKFKCSTHMHLSEDAMICIQQVHRRTDDMTATFCMLYSYVY